MKRAVVLAALLVAGLATAPSASAAPILVGVDHFGAADLITFDELTNGTPILDQYAALGVTFSTGLVATDALAFGGLGMTATNGDPAVPIGTDITLSLAHVRRVGFDIITQDSSKTQFLISAFSGGVLTATGSFVVDTDFSKKFVGIEDLENGIDRLVINAFKDDATNPDAPFLINDLRVSVPEPATMALVGLGLVGVAVRRRRSTR